MRPAQAGYQLATEIADALVQMERHGNPARWVLASPAAEGYARAVAALRPELTVRVFPMCPPGKLYLMADLPPEDAMLPSLWGDRETP